MRDVFSLRVFKQMGAHTRARIHSLFLTLTRSKTMFSHDQILIKPKSYGHVHESVSRNYVLAVQCCRCIDLKVQLITAVSAVLSQIIYQECVAR